MTKEFSDKIWPTPLSEFQSLYFISLEYSSKLSVTCRVMSETGPWRMFSIEFPDAIFFRIVDEDFGDGKYVSAFTKHGPTFSFSTSPWLSELASSAILFAALCETWGHKVIFTTNKIVEIVTPSDPIFRELDMVNEVKGEESPIKQKA